MSIKKLIFFIALVLVFIGCLWYYRFSIMEEKSEVSKNKVAGEETISKEGEEPKISEDSRKEILSHLSGNIAVLSPEEPVLGGSWLVNRFWFTKDDNFVYVEYEDGHIMRQILVEIDIEQEPYQYHVIGFFEPAEDGWKLTQGGDAAFSKKLDLYEHDEEIGEWMKRN